MPRWRDDAISDANMPWPEATNSGSLFDLGVLEGEATQDPS